jgi:predicted GIY-YIG superfamily endonuclease
MVISLIVKYIVIPNTISNMRTKFLYAIKDPHTNTPVYVGQTVNVERRYQEHLRGNQRIDQWMREMIGMGVLPETEIISRHHRAINAAERSMIRRMSRKYSLFNQLIPVT